MAHFEIRNLSFSYTGSTRQILSGIDLTIEKGEYILLCGKSGSGKTTLLRHLKSVLAPHGSLSGDVLFNGIPLTCVSRMEQASKIGFVMQNPDDQIVTDKVWHELAFGLENLGTDLNTMRLRVSEMACYFGIQDWFHRDVAELSGGQKQLLNLASIMAMQPEVLILDEPTSQLDPIAAADFLNTVRKINLELGTTVILTEHRLEDIYHAADRVIVMEDGRITACDTPAAAAAQLRNGQMFTALPAPVRIFYGSGAEGTCPLTVREGRTWLSKTFSGRSLIQTEPEVLPENISAANAALRVKDAWFRYERNSPDILRGVSFTVPQGSLFSIVGGNGAGKSTLLKSICGICRPYRGNVEIFGRELKKYPPAQRFHGCLSMLPQDPKSLFVKASVRDELLEMNTTSGEIRTIAELCEIGHLLDAHPQDLSGGEQQRVALAKVLLTSPRLLLLDEPTKGLDSFFKIKFAEILANLKSRGITIVMVSHDVEFCAEYADLVSMFFDGQILTTDTPHRFFGQNSFYTTAANRMSRCVFRNAVTAGDVVGLYRKNLEDLQ